MTDAVAGLLAREISPDDASKFIAQLAALLEECVNFGTHVFVWSDARTKKGGYHDASLLLLYRHVLEMMDGVSVLVQKAVVDPCQPLLRSAMEASMSIEYMLEKDTERRALAYQVAHIRKRIAEHTRHDPATEAGKTFQKIFDQDILFSGVKLRAHASAPAIDKLAKVLAMPEYTDVDREWERLYVKLTKEKRKGFPPWYSLFSGPRSIRQLAYHLKLGASYDVLYSDWSEVVHAGGAMLTVAGHASTVRPLRHAGRAQLVTSLASSFTLRITRMLLGYYAPTKLAEYTTWYKTNVSEFHLKIASGEILRVM